MKLKTLFGAGPAVRRVLPGMEPPSRTTNSSKPGVELKPEDISNFPGGQIESANFQKSELYVGDIYRIAIDGKQLRIGFSHVVKGEQFPPFPRRWVKDDRNSLIVDMGTHQFAYLEAGKTGGIRIFVQSDDKSQSFIFYPANGRKFPDLSAIEGRSAVV